MKARVHQESLARALRTEHSSKTSHEEARVRNERERGRKEKADGAAGGGTQTRNLSPKMPGMWLRRKRTELPGTRCPNCSSSLALLQAGADSVPRPERPYGLPLPAPPVGEQEREACGMELTRAAGTGQELAPGPVGPRPSRKGASVSYREGARPRLPCAPGAVPGQSHGQCL